MASAHNLLGVVNQLQSMENTLTAILIETALKLSSLTDTKVFVLVDSTEGRRFAGAPQLCQSYASNSLSPIGNDIEVLLQPNVKTLRERPLYPHPTENGFVASTYTPIPDRLDQSQNFGARPVLSNHVPNQIIPQLLDSRGRLPAANQRKRPASSIGRHSTFLKVAKREGDNLNENGNGVNDYNMNLGAEGDSQLTLMSNDESEVTQEPEELEAGVQDPHFSMEPYAPHKIPYEETYDCEVDVNVSFVDDFLSDNQKADRVREIADGSAAEKNSVNHKLTMSLLYDFAKCIFVNCPYQDYKTPAFRLFFESSFQKFWESFPNFNVWEENCVRFQIGIDKKTETALTKTTKSFIRKYIRNGVADLKIKKSGRRRTSLKNNIPAALPLTYYSAPYT